MIKVKLFSISKENDAFLEFIKSEPGMENEEADEMLEKYMNHWFRQNRTKEIVKISNPKLVGNHLMAMVWYKTP